MRAEYHGQYELLLNLDRVYENNESDTIQNMKEIVRQYEKAVRERGAELVNQELTGKGKKHKK